MSGFLVNSITSATRGGASTGASTDASVCPSPMTASTPTSSSSPPGALPDGLNPQAARNTKQTGTKKERRIGFLHQEWLSLMAKP
ncbi:MAG: hypothetical protein HYT15_00210 [Candidatus Magasanikbacteria bacterium]|nr:hypothetical protein [Candidatus Magasanikbacteria bacterium]